MDSLALNKVSYGLYVVTACDNGKDNGCINNTVMQITSSAPFVSTISLSKESFTHDMIAKTKKFNVSVLTVDAPFTLFEHFGFTTGAKVDKFADYKSVDRSQNGALYLTEYTNAYLSFDVLDTFDFGSHTLFKSVLTDSRVINEDESLTYAYYHKHVKPKPADSSQIVGGYQCNICGYVFEGDVLPDDFICPLCKHGASDFMKLM